jgi:hypothetical protein
MTELDRLREINAELLAALEDCLYAPPWSSNPTPNRVDHSIRADITARAQARNFREANPRSAENSEYYAPMEWSAYTAWMAAVKEALSNA